MKPSPTKAKPAFVSHSGQTGSDYLIYVDAPEIPPPEGGYPTMFVMDGDYMFDPAVEASRSLSAEGRIPPTVVVGVGYGAGFGRPGNFRGRDYTPTSSADEPTSGGADAFLAYLSGKLWPELYCLRPLRETGRVIAGHSLGSLLVLHALFQEEPFFDRALASAPSIWWDNRSILGLIAKMRDRKASIAGRLYLGVGSEDSPSMLGDIDLLAKQLEERPFDGLEVHSEQFSGRDHYDVVPHTMAAGLLSLLN